jgi:hypothetical protein
VESDDPAHGPAKNELPCYITTGKARKEVVMSDDVEGHSEGKHLQMVEIRVRGGSIHR